MTAAEVATELDMGTSITPGVRVDNVRVGERARQDYGDIEKLKASMREHGLLQPIVLLPDNYLLCGGRRLQAAKELGWESIAAVWSNNQNDAISRLKAERDENTCRKEMTPSELVAIGKKLEELKRPEAADRQRRGGALGGSSFGSADQKLEGLPVTTRHEVADALGMSESQYKRAKRVVDAAEDESAPEIVRTVAVEAKAEMDAGTLSITGAENRLKAAHESVQAAKAARVPESERVQQITPLAAAGHSSEQIAQQLGIGATHVKAIAGRNGIDLIADRLRGRTRRAGNSDRVVAETVATLDGLTAGLALINYEDLDEDLVQDWATSLATSMSEIKKFANKVAEKAKRPALKRGPLPTTELEYASE